MASSSSSHQYDVFLSFRGTDTRRKFTSHLYRELQTKVTTFKDDRILRPGDSLPDELPDAIKESKIALVVISEDYASSRWCLKELQMIMELKRKGTLDVFPIFYEVDPSDVRKQTGTFAAAFQRYEGREEPEKVSKWREALAEVANLTGVVSRDWQDEAQMVQYVGKKILNQLFAMPPEEPSDLIGMDTRFEDLKPLLSTSDDEVRMIGIWGIGGTGKTTTARYLYEKLSCQFPLRCFIHDVKKFHGERGWENLRRQFLSQIFNDESLRYESFQLNSNAIQDRLSRKKVLAVLDDVDNLDQLEAVAKRNSWFGSGSRIIITTRDKRLLRSHDITLVYEVECLKHDVACRFFNRFAFSGGQVPDKSKELAVRASELARGLPLALKVLGSYLRGSGKEEWEIAVRKLSDDPREDVMKCLKVSYDGLTKENQRIFLIVACFFNHGHASHVSQIIEGEEGEVRGSLNRLAEKALIGISYDGRVIVHDLIHDMATEIANNERGKPRFLVDFDWNFEALSDGMGTDAIEGISLNMGAMPYFPLGSQGFENMPNLKYLRVFDGLRKKSQTDINHLPRGLRSLVWYNFALTNLPSTFRGEFLVELHLSGTKIKELSEGTLSLQNLRRLNLRYCSNLEEISVLNGATKLEELDLSFCGNLVKFPSSFSFMEKLTSLCLTGCRKLEFLPSLAGLKSLKAVNLRYCGCLKSFPKLPGSVVELYMGSTSISEVPESIRNLVALEVLDLSGCLKLSEISSVIGNVQSVKTLHLQNCKNLRRISDSIGSLTVLEDLSLEGCSKLSNIPSTIGNLMALTSLSLSGCKMLSEIPSTIGNLAALTSLSLSGCQMLSEIPSTIGNLTALKTLDLDGCTRLQDFPITNGNLTSLEILYPPEDVNCIFKIINAFCYGNQHFNTSNINFFFFRGHKKGYCERALESHAIEVLRLNLGAFRPFGVPSRCTSLSLLPHLRRLSLCYCNIQEISDDLGCLRALQSLDLSGNFFKVLPESIKQLSLLEELVLSRCRNLRIMPELPQGIKYLHANHRCSLKSVSNVSEHPFLQLILNGCFELGEDPLLLIQRMISMPFHKEEVNALACFSASEPPDCFNHRSKGQNLTICCPETDSNLKPVGFVAGVLVDCGPLWEIACLGIQCGFQFGHILVDFKSLPSHASFYGLKGDILIVFSYNFGEEKSCDGISFHFDLDIDIGRTYPWIQRSKIKGCGIHLCFTEESQHRHKEGGSCRQDIA